MMPGSHMASIGRPVHQMAVMTSESGCSVGFELKCIRVAGWPLRAVC